MNKKLLHKIVSVWTVLLLLLPIGVQFAHAIENHEHVVCDSKELQHIHNLELDCSVYHVKLTNESLALVANFKFTKPKVNNSIPTYFISREEDVSLYYKSTRGPPQFIV